MSKLRQFRTSRGLTGAELAKRAGITRGYVHHLESGVRLTPGLVTLNALCEALSLTAEERAELILHFADRQGAAVAPEVGTAGTGQMLPADCAGEEAA